MSRAEYYREYRLRKKADTTHKSASGDTTLLHNIVAELRQEIAELRNAVQHLAEVCKALQSRDLADEPAVSVAQQPQQSVAQHVEPSKVGKRKGSSPPSSPPSLPPHTPPNSPPLLSPPTPKENAPQDFAARSGDSYQDHPDAPLVDVGRSKVAKNLATWEDLKEAANFVWIETQSDSLQDAFYDWIEYKSERGAKEFYTRKGMLNEAKRFVRRHFEEYNVVRAVERAIASNWQGWDHN
jgi:hypothetical protein